MRLGFNIDHIAYLRESRKINDPDPLEAVFIAKRSGAHQITLHLREDRRHVNECDLKRVIDSSFLPVNVEASVSKEITDIICKLVPHRVTLVPEKREEVTTEGGLRLHAGLRPVIDEIKSRGMQVTLFVDPTEENLEIAMELGVSSIELHTGKYANLSLMLHSNLPRTPNSIREMEPISRADIERQITEEVENIRSVSRIARQKGNSVYAGHGLNYSNVSEIAQIEEIEELNIGQSIIARALFTGLDVAIRDMISLMTMARGR